MLPSHASLLQAKQRVNVSKLVPPNLSGGYLLAYENDNIEDGAGGGGQVQCRHSLCPASLCLGQLVHSRAC